MSGAAHAKRSRYEVIEVSDDDNVIEIGSDDDAGDDDDVVEVVGAQHVAKRARRADGGRTELGEARR